MTDITSVVWPGHFLCCSVSEWPPPDTEPAQVRICLPRLSVTQATSEHTTTALWCCRSSPRKAAYPVVWPLCPGDDLATVVAGDLPELRDAGARAALLLAILFSRARSQEACKTQPGLSHGDDTCKRFGYRPGVCQAEGLPGRPECSSSARCLIVWSIFRSIRKWTGSRTGNSSSNQDGRGLARTRTRSRQPISVGSSTKAQVQSRSARERSVAAAAVMRSMR
jgi:hypothetical protein